MGLPSINIAFKEAGTTAELRGERGIAALILKDSTNNGLITLGDVTDIPSDLSAYNQKQLQDTWIGGTNIPKKVIAYVEATAVTDYSTAMEALEGEHWNYLAVPAIASSDTTAIATWIKGLRDNKDMKVKAVLPNTASDHEGIINLSTDNIVVGSTTYAATDYCARIAGLLAGTPLTQSATYAVLSEVTDVPHLTKTEFDTAINAGEFVLINDGTKVKVARAVNSLVTTTADKGADYKKIKLVDIMDQIHDDIKTTVEDNYVGKYANNYNNKCLLLTALGNYFDSLAADNIVDTDYTLGIDIAAQTSYLKAEGIDVSEMTEKQIKEANTGDSVFVAGNLTILDAIEDFNFNVVI